MVRKESAVILEVVYNMLPPRPPPLPPRSHGAVSVGGVWFPLFGLWGVFSATVPAVSSVNCGSCCPTIRILGFLPCVKLVRRRCRGINRSWLTLICLRQVKRPCTLGGAAPHVCFTSASAGSVLRVGG